MAIKSLILKQMGFAGINTDIAPWDLAPEYITSGVNFKIDGNSIKSSSGYNDWSTPPVNFNAGYLMPVKTSASDFWLVAGRSACYAFDGVTWADVSSVTGYAGVGVDDELNWTGCKIGSIPIINNPQATPEYWSPQSSGQVLQPLNFDAGNTWDAKGYSFQVIRSHKNFLFALNLQEGLTEFPSSYRWSHPADINGLPFSWDETDPSSLAGKAQVGGDSGAIIDGLSLRDSFVIYSEKGISILDPSNDEFVWHRRELSNTVGVVSKQTIVEVQGDHYFIGDGDIYKNDGRSIKSIFHNILKNSFNVEINVEFFNRSYTIKQTVENEIWFCVPVGDAEYPNKAYIYNWNDQSWAIRELPYVISTDGLGAVTIDHAITYTSYGPRSVSTITWDDLTQPWDDLTQPWGNTNNGPLNNVLVGLDFSDSSLKIMDPDNASLGSLGTNIERTGFPLGGDPGVTTTSRVYPHITGSAEVKIQFGSQGQAGGPVRWKAAQSFLPTVDRKIDVRTTGELLCWRISSSGTGNFEFSGMTIEYTPAGYR